MWPVDSSHKSWKCGNFSMSRRNHDWKKIICLTRNKMKSLYLDTMDKATIQGGFPGSLFLRFIVMTLWLWSIFRISRLLWGESSGHRCNPLHPPHNAQMWCFFMVNRNKVLRKGSLLWHHPYVKADIKSLFCNSLIFLCSQSGAHDYINPRKWHAHSRPI